MSDPRSSYDRITQKRTSPAKGIKATKKDNNTNATYPLSDTPPK